jgi:hypothetical protein
MSYETLSSTNLNNSEVPRPLHTKDLKAQELYRKLKELNLAPEKLINSLFHIAHHTDGNHCRDYRLGIQTVSRKYQFNPYIHKDADRWFVALTPDTPSLLGIDAMRIALEFALPAMMESGHLGTITSYDTIYNNWPYACATNPDGSPSNDNTYILPYLHFTSKPKGDISYGDEYLDRGVTNVEFILVTHRQKQQLEDDMKTLSLN